MVLTLLRKWVFFFTLPSPDRAVLVGRIGCTLDLQAHSPSQCDALWAFRTAIFGAHRNIWSQSMTRDTAAAWFQTPRLKLVLGLTLCLQKWFTSGRDKCLIDGPIALRIKHHSHSLQAVSDGGTLTYQDYIISRVLMAWINIEIRLYAVSQSVSPLPSQCKQDTNIP